MATSQLNGINFTINGDLVEFFGARGVKLPGGRWALERKNPGLHATHKEWVEVEKHLQRQVHEYMRYAEIVVLEFNPRWALMFYFEGFLSDADLARASEGDGLINISDIVVDGRTVSVRIIKENRYCVAGMNKSNDLICGYIGGLEVLATHDYYIVASIEGSTASP